MTAEEVQLRNYASRLKTIFMMRKADVENRPYRPYKKFDDINVWLRVAKVVLELKADPEDYIDAQFKLSKSVVFANSLHGPSAKNKYKQYAAMCLRTSGTQAIMAENTSLKAVELGELIADMWHDLDLSCGTHDMTNKNVIKHITDKKLRYDPFAVLLVCPIDEYKRLYGDEARDILTEHPYLRTAAENLNLGMSIKFIEQ